MTANELRIGNLILNGIGEVFPVNEITIGNFHASQSVLGAFKPIPLTEEELLRMGFEQHPYHFVKGKFLIHEVGHYSWSLMMFDVVYDEHVDLEIVDFLHQLQNLYFALTGEELKIQTT